MLAYCWLMQFHTVDKVQEMRGEAVGGVVSSMSVSLFDSDMCAARRSFGS